MPEFFVQINIKSKVLNMIKIYPTSDFSLEIPVNLAGLTLKEGATVSFSVFTINRDESYNFTVNDNTIPSRISLSGSVLQNMPSGIVQAVMTINIPDGNMDDSYYNYSRIITTSYFWVSDSVQVSIAGLNSKITDLSNNLSTNYYDKSSIDSMFDNIDISADVDRIIYLAPDGLGSPETDNVEEALDELYTSVHSNTQDIAYLVADNSTNKNSITSLTGDLETLRRDLQNNYYASSFIDLNYYGKDEIDTMLSNVNVDTSVIDASILLLEHMVKDLDTSVATNYYTKSFIDTYFYTKDVIDASVSHNYYTMAAVDTMLQNLDVSVDTSDFVDVSTFENTNYAHAVALAVHDTSIGILDASVGELDASMGAAFLMLGDIETALNNIINS